MTGEGAAGGAAFATTNSMADLFPDRAASSVRMLHAPMK
jgi:hypothetical protein